MNLLFGHGCERRFQRSDRSPAPASSLAGIKAVGGQRERAAGRTGDTHLDSDFASPPTPHTGVTEVGAGLERMLMATQWRCFI